MLGFIALSTLCLIYYKTFVCELSSLHQLFLGYSPDGMDNPYLSIVIIQHLRNKQKPAYFLEQPAVAEQKQRIPLVV